ncbi:conjugal transfer protein TraC, partial [Escherichia coli]
MNTTEHPVRQLLWCALNALRAAQENHGINSESGLRRYLLEWLSGAGRHPEFRDIPEEIMALKALAEQNRDIPVTATLNTLFLSSATVGECPLFRFRAAMGRLQKAGWRTTVCPWTERVFSESIELACTGRRHLLQLSRTEECFMPSGQMRAPVYLQLIT